MIQYFYPRPPRGGRREVAKKYAIIGKFLSTPSARRATERWPCCSQFQVDFYPRPPRGGRPPLERPKEPRRAYFYPRPPRGGRRNHGDDAAALRDFYPRPPRGGRHGSVGLADLQGIFLSTPSARRATICKEAVDGIILKFLSTPSARRATRLACCGCIVARLFLSTPSARRATAIFFRNKHRCLISIHALREEGDGPLGRYIAPAIVFLSTPSARRATLDQQQKRKSQSISIHALREEGDSGRTLI